MSREVDERIVAMYFDNEDFERNAAKTIETLEELKNSTNMTGVGKGFEVFEEAKKKLNFDKVTQGIGTFKTAVSSAGTVFKKAFNIVSPLDNIYNSLKTFTNKYLNRVIGFDVAHKVESTIENAFRNLTIAPISAGWSQYENTMDSVKTIMSSTGETIDVVKGKLNEMTNYANKTIYSLNDMTSNLGKFTNNGVKLDDATDAMIGLANATADAGQGSAQASAAMYNVSQAIGVGKMTSIDWKSLENANIATVKLKQTFIDAAVAGGQLITTTEEINGETITKYWTKNEKGIKDTEVTVENFRDTLSEGWLDKETMLNTFKIYSGELNENEIMALGFSREEAVRLKQIGEEALKAAQEVRTFSKMMDALKEGVQSTWATSFEYIFGDMEEGTNLWTRLNGEIEEVLNKSNEARNNILLSWRGMMLDENGEAKKIEEIYNAKASALEYDLTNGNISLDEYNRQMELLNETIGNTALWTDYRDVAIDAFFEMFDSIKSIVSAISGAWTDVFGSFNADTLKGITQSFKDFAEKFQNWLGSADDADSRLSKIRRTFAGLFRVVKAGWTVFKSIISAGFAIIKPVIDPILNALATIGDWLDLGNVENLGDAVSKLGQKLSDLWNSLSSLGWSGVFSKIGGWITDLWANIKSGITTWLNDNGLGFVVTWFNNVKTKLEEGWAVVTEWWESSGVGTFFSDLWETISGWFTSKTVEGKMGNSWTEDSPIVSLFKNAWESIQKAFEEIKNWGIWSDIGDFFSSVWESIVGIFQTKTVEGKMGNSWVEEAPIVAFFKSVWQSISDFFEEVKGWEIWTTIGTFFSGVWDTVVGLFKVPEGAEEAPIVSFFKSVWQSISDFFEEVKGWEIWTSIGDFFSGIWDSVTGIFKTKTVEGKRGNSWTEDAPIVSAIRSVWDAITNVFSEIERWWNSEENVIDDFFAGVWDTVSGIFKEGPNGEEAPIVTFFTTVKTKLTEAWDALSSFIQESGIRDFFANTWNWLMEKLGLPTKENDTNGKASLFNYENLMASASGITELNGVVPKFTRESLETEKASDADIDSQVEELWIVRFFKKIAEALESAWNSVTGWGGWASVGKFFSDIWTWISETVSGILTGAEESSSKDDANTVEKSIEEKKSFLTTVGEFIGQIFASIGDLLKEAVSSDVAQASLGLIKDIVVGLYNVVDLIVGYIGRVSTTLKEGTDAEGAMTTGDYIATGIVAVFSVFSKITSVINTKNLATISESGGVLTNIGGQMLKLSAAVLLIALAIKYIGSIDPGQLWTGVAAVVVIGAVLAVVVAKITSLSNSFTKNDPTKVWERVAGKLITTLGVFGSLWLVLDKLPTIIEALSEAKKYSGLSGEDIAQTMLGVLEIVGGLMLVTSLMSKISPTGVSPTATFKTVVSTLEVLLGVVVALFAAGGIMQGMDAIFGEEAVDETIDKAVRLFNGIGKFINGFIQGLFGAQSDEEKIASARESLESLDEIAKEFNLEQTTGIIRIINMMTRIGDLSKTLDVQKIENLSIAMGHVGDALNKFVWMVLGSADEYSDIRELLSRGDEGVQQMNDIIGLCNNMFSMMAELAGISFGDMGLERFINWANGTDKAYSTGPTDFINAVNQVIDAAGGLHDGSNIHFDGIQIIQKLYDSIQQSFDNPSDDLPEFNAQPIVDAIVKGIGIEDAVIAGAVHDMIQSGINLVGEESDYSNFDWSSVTGEGSPLSGLLSLDASSLIPDVSDLIDVSDLTDTVTAALKDATGEVDLSEDLENAQSAISGFNLKISGFDMSALTDVDENGVPTIISTIQSELDGMEDTDLTIKIVPVIDMTNFGEEWTKLDTFVQGQVPLNINGTFNLGDQALNINGEEVVNEIRMLRDQMSMNQQAIYSAIGSVESGFGSKFDALSREIAGMKLYLDGNTLVGGIIGRVDSSLYKRAYIAAKTGISVQD